MVTLSTGKHCFPLDTDKDNVIDYDIKCLEVEVGEDLFSNRGVMCKVCANNYITSI